MKEELKDIIYSLNTFKSMRDELINKTINKDPDLFIGLYNIRENSLFDTYIQRFKVSWLIEHSEEHKRFLDNKLSNESKNRYNSAIESFSSIYRQFLEYNGRNFNRDDIGIQLLDDMKLILSDIIDVSEKWEESYKKLEVMAAKNKVEYNKRIKQLRG